MERMLAGNGYMAQEFVSALTVALVMLIPQVLLLMPLYAALVGGDLVAKEAEDGTLRMILSRPVSRFNLLLVKWAAGAIFLVVVVVVATDHMVNPAPALRLAERIRAKTLSVANDGGHLGLSMGMDAVTIAVREFVYSRD